MRLPYGAAVLAAAVLCAVAASQTARILHRGDAADPPIVATAGRISASVGERGHITIVIANGNKAAEVVRVRPWRSAPTAVATSESRVAVAYEDGRLVVVEAKGGVTRFSIAMGTPAAAVVFAGDLLLIASSVRGGGLSTLRLDSPGHGARTKVLLEATRAGTKITALTRTDNGMAIGFADGGVQLHRLDGRKILEVGSPQGMEVTCIRASHERLAVARSDGTVTLIGFNGTRSQEIAAHSGPVIGLGLNLGDAHSLMTVGWDGFVRLWSIAGRMLGEYRIFAIPVDIDAHGQILVTEDGSVTHLAAGGALIRRIDAGHDGALYHAAISPDGLVLATAATDRTARLHDVSSGAVTVLRGHRAAVTSVAFAPGGDRLASGSADGTVRVWTRTGEHQKTLDVGIAVNAVAWHPNGLGLAAGDRSGRIKLFNLSGDEPCERIFDGHSDDIKTLAFDPTGRFLASGADDALTLVFDAATGAVVHRFDHHRRSVHSVAFSPDGAKLLTGALDLAVVIRDLASGSIDRRVGGFESSVNTVAFDDGGSRFVAATSDGRVHVVDVATGKTLHRLPPHRLAAVWAVFEPGSKRVFSGSTDAEVRLFDLGLNRSVGHYPRRPVVIEAPPTEFVATWTKGEVIVTVRGKARPVVRFALLSRPRVLAADAGRTIWIDAAGHVMGRGNLQSAVPRRLGRAPDGVRLLATSAEAWAIGGENGIVMWETGSGSRASIFCFDGAVRGLWFDRGHLNASTSGGGHHVLRHPSGPGVR